MVTKNVGGIKVAGNSIDVAELTVLVDSRCVDGYGNVHNFNAGDKVYVPGNLFSTSWAKDKWSFKDSDEKFIFVPPQEILLVRPLPPPSRADVPGY